MENRAFNNYKNFSSADFICEPFFQDWVAGAADGDDGFWQQFLLQHPEVKENMLTARAFLERIRFREEWPEQERAAALFEQHWLQAEAFEREDLQQDEGNEKKSTVIIIVRRFWWMAAMLAAAVVISVTWYRAQTGSQTIATEYGSRRTVTFPDGSLVVLNAHSSVEYHKDWSAGKTREVWLTGEGYFDVKPSTEKAAHTAQPFKVHAGALTVEVLGTRFDVRNRRGVTEVALEQGRVAVHVDGRGQNGIGQKRILMQPGEVLVFNKDKNEIVKDTANVTDYSAWKKNRLILRNPTVYEIAGYLEDNFGYRIIIEDSSMWSRKVNGPILYDNLNDALFILSTVLNTKVIKTDSTITLRPR